MNIYFESFQGWEIDLIDSCNYITNIFELNFESKNLRLIQMVNRIMKSELKLILIFNSVHRIENQIYKTDNMFLILIMIFD